MDAAAQALLGAVADTARASGLAWTVRERADRVEIDALAADGVSVVVRADEDSVVVVLHGGPLGGDAAAGPPMPPSATAGAWERRFPREDDPEDDADALALAHDLVAAALWGRARLRVEHVGRQGEPWRTTVCFGAPGRWLTFDRKGGGLRAPWARVRVAEHRNDGSPPRRIDEAKLRPLPWAPWAGIRGQAPPEPPPVQLPVDGQLDLHAFSPKDVEALVLETIAQHRARGILALRIVHGKGIGNLRRTVHALLERHPGVATYRIGGHGEGSWGATLVELRPADEH